MFLHAALHVVVWVAAGGAGDAIKSGAGAACAGACNMVELKTVFKNAANTLTYLVGAASVLMIIYGGLRYVISRGDASQIKMAKETLLYAVIGVVVSIVAFGIVNFVVKAI